MSCLDIAGLRVCFATPEGLVRAVDGVDLTVGDNEILGLVGETGCGKTVLGLSIMRLLPRNATMEGQVRYNGLNLLALDEDAMRKIRGREIAMMLQNPSTSLNPVMRIQDQVAESILAHNKAGKREAKARSLEFLEFVGIPAHRVRDYPHEFSGGMRQRAALAMAMASGPSVLIADEPTKMLDGPRKVQILALIQRMQQESEASLLFITHDLLAAFTVCHRIAVMYAGEIVELATPDELSQRPLHPYAQGLLESVPRRGLKPIGGASPSLVDLPSGCRFHPRCPVALPACHTSHPVMCEAVAGHFVRCLRHGSRGSS
jgi:peptide/nickel transport system ATP-binding protein